MRTVILDGLSLSDTWLLSQLGEGRWLCFLPDKCVRGGADEVMCLPGGQEVQPVKGMLRMGWVGGLGCQDND